MTIIDDDLPPKVGFTVASSSFGEGRRHGDDRGEPIGRVGEAGKRELLHPGRKVGGTATNGTDYTITPGTLTFAPGETVKTISITLTQDAIQEPDETIKLRLNKPVNARLVTPLHTLTITDDD